MTDRLPAALVRPLTRPDPMRNALLIAADWGMIIAAAVTAEAIGTVWAWLVAVVIIGARQHALLILMHEATHHGLFRRRWLNEAVGEAAVCWPLLISMVTYRRNHTAHHRHTNTPDDPDWLRYNAEEAPYRSQWQFPMSGWRLAGIFARDLLGLNTVEQLRKLLLFGGTRKASDPRRARLRLLYTAALAAAITVAGAWKLVLLYWVVPMLTWLKLSLRVRLIAEHSAVGGAMGNRTTLHGPLVGFLFAPHNILYHAEHHAYPGVRHHNLPALHALLAERGLLGSGIEGTFEVREGMLPVLRACTQGRVLP